MSDKEQLQTEQWFQCPICQQMGPRQDVVLDHMEEHEKREIAKWALLEKEV